MPKWSLSSDFSLIHNPSSVWSYGSKPHGYHILIQTNGVAMHPDGSNGSFSVVRFTAPKDGNYVLDVIFTSIESCARHSGVYIIYNNVTTLWEIDLNGPEDSKSFKTTDSGIPIRANENIDFIVGEGLNRVICHMTLAQLDIHLLENQTKFPIIAGSIGFGFVLGIIISAILFHIYYRYRENRRKGYQAMN
ncbi:hypothetical protein GLOIN_2v1717197 [Rhizophagus clarus]|uniref:Uncharacterized protein n=1 Tax=Rhizophagus clarus TaxID=94130 RepID=A0A8H3LPG9_9GLOM|nr:hypothetical protein GLOIN_2v1717197 [Rhizophagus clarus]